MSIKSFSQVKSISYPGKIDKPNEDTIFVSDNLLVVLDGATGIGDNYIDPQKSDAYWFVNKIKQEIIEKHTLYNSYKQLLSDIMRSVSMTYYRRLGDKGIDYTRMERYEKPSASMIAVSIEGNRVFMHRFGDCDALLYSKGKAEKVFPASLLNSLDDISIKEHQVKLNEGYSLTEAREAIKPILISNRLKINQKDGYPCLTIDPYCAQYMETKEIYPEKEDEILLCSDGISPIYEEYAYFTPNDIFNYSPNEILEVIRRIESKDYDITAYPRLKISDDASLIKAKIY